MTMARYQFTVTDDQGNIVPDCQIEVRRETPGLPLVQLYSDRAGTSAIGNPVAAESDGYIAFHVSGGAFKIRAFKDGFERIWRYVGIGLAAETDLTAEVVAQMISDAAASYENLCTNPGMQIWQNPNRTLADAPHRSVLADGWLWGTDFSTSTARFTVSRSTDVPNDKVPYSIKIECTTNDTSVASGDSGSHLRWAVYGTDFAPHQAKTVTARFWVQSNKPGMYSVVALNEARDRSFGREFTIQAADTWEQVTLTFPFDTKMGTWNTGHGMGFSLRFCLYAGATFRTTPDAWQTGNFTGTSNLINFGDTIGNTFHLTEVQISPGEPGSFKLPSDTDAFMAALRQYRVIDCAIAGVNFYGFASGAGAVNFDLLLGTPMMAPPVTTCLGTLDTHLQLQNLDGTPITGGTFDGSFNRSKDVAKFTYSKSAAFTQYRPYSFRLDNVAGKIVIDGHLA